MLKFHPFYSFSLKENDICLWYIELDKLFNIKDIDNNLAEEELERANRFVFDIHRKRFKASRFALRYLLSSYLGIKAQDIEFKYGSHGKPKLTNNSIRFNLSHSGSFCVIAVSLNKSLGVDVESLSERDYLGIAHHSFSTMEIALLSELSDTEKASGFFRIWTQKEAFIKLSGRGLNYPLKSFSVSPTSPKTLLHVDNDRVSSYEMKTFALSKSLFVALCVNAPLNQLYHHQFTYPLSDKTTLG